MAPIQCCGVSATTPCVTANRERTQAVARMLPSVKFMRSIILRSPGRSRLQLVRSSITDVPK